MATRRSSRLSRKRSLDEHDAVDASELAKRARPEDSQDHPMPVESHDRIEPFRLMDLPTEIRLEIYRACLTRPFNILLSRHPEPEAQGSAYSTSDSEHEPSDEDDHIFAAASPATRRGTGSPRYIAGSTALIHGGHGYQTSPPRAHAIPGTTTRRPPNAALQALRRVIPARPSNSHHSPRPMMPPPGIFHATLRPQPGPRPQSANPLLVALLRTSKAIYREARPVLYGENSFDLDIYNAHATLAALHQRSRGQIRYLRLSIPTHHDILDEFAVIVRLSLRYCWRLQVFTISMPFTMPENSDNTGLHNTTYANGFDILRWLPKQCRVVLEGNVSEKIRNVVNRNAVLAKDLDEQLAYARRQLIAMSGASNS